MKIKDLKTKDEKTLRSLLLEQRQKVNELKFSNNFGKVKNFNEIKSIKKTIAQILTILNSKINLS